MTPFYRKFTQFFSVKGKLPSQINMILLLSKVDFMKSEIFLSVSYISYIYFIISSQVSYGELSKIFVHYLFTFETSCSISIHICNIPIHFRSEVITLKNFLNTSVQILRGTIRFSGGTIQISFLGDIFPKNDRKCAKNAFFSRFLTFFGRNVT